MNDEESLLAEKANETERLRLQVLRLCHAVPQGQVTSYGALGAQCDPPISGYICGRVMGQVMEGAPWWRIVGKDGRLPISKRGPNHSLEQRKHLEDEGVKFDEDGRVEKRFFVDAAEDKGEGQGTLF